MTVADKPWFRFARIAVAVVALSLVAGHVGSLSGILAGFGEARLPFVAAALLLLPANLLIQFLKWHFILRASLGKVAPGRVLGSLFIGHTLGLVTPGGLGEVGRGIYIEALRPQRGVVLVCIDKLSNGIAILTMGLLGLGYLATLTRLPIIRTSFLISLVLAMVFAIASVLVFRHRSAISGLMQAKPQRKWLINLAATLASLSLWSPSRLTLVLVYSLGFHLVFMAQFILLLLSFSSHALLQICGAALVAMAAKALLPISAADLGIREGAAVFFLGLVNVSGVHAFNAAFFLFAMNILLPGIAGLFLLQRWSPASTTKRPHEGRDELSCSSG